MVIFMVVEPPKMAELVISRDLTVEGEFLLSGFTKNGDFMLVVHQR